MVKANGRDMGHMARQDSYEHPVPYLRATEEVGPGVGMWFGTECLLP